MQGITSDNKSWCCAFDPTNNLCKENITIRAEQIKEDYASNGFWFQAYKNGFKYYTTEPIKITFTLILLTHMVNGKQHHIRLYKLFRHN